MAIVESKSTRYKPVCDNCGWEGYRVSSLRDAELRLKVHKCGEHRPTHGSGHHRGILGGYWDECVCGKGWANLDGSPWKCPNAALGEAH